MPDAYAKYSALQCRSLVIFVISCLVSVFIHPGAWLDICSSTLLLSPLKIRFEDALIVLGNDV
jgi:hypothetical protein